MKVLLVSNFEGGWPFIQELRDNLCHKNIVVDVFDPSKNELITSNEEKVLYVHLNVWKFILKIPIVRSIIKRLVNHFNQLITIRTIYKIQKSYDIIEIHYVSAWHYLLLKKINEKRKTILVYWGSDLYVDKYYLKNPTHKFAEYLVFGRKSMAVDFLNLCGYENNSKIRYLTFGIGMFDYIKRIEQTYDKVQIRNYFGISKDSILITCGHNARDLMQHELIIENIFKVKEYLPQNYILVFPFTYRFNQNYYLKIKALLETYELKYKFILDFMSMEELARLRIITDIHINFVTSDGLNASMLENLYANTIVINGSWLNYDTLDNKGIFYIQAGIDTLYLELQNILKNFSDYFNLTKKNKEIVYKHFSWANAIEDRIELYKKITN